MTLKVWLADHLAAALGSTSVLAAATGYVVRRLPGLVQKEVAFLDARLLAGVKHPAARQLLIDVEAAVAKAVPDAGDARYAAAADLLLSHLAPAAAVAARPLLIAVLSGLGAGAKAAVTAVSTAPPP